MKTILKIFNGITKWVIMTIGLLIILAVTIIGFLLNNGVLDDAIREFAQGDIAKATAALDTTHQVGSIMSGVGLTILIVYFVSEILYGILSFVQRRKEKKSEK